MAYLEQDFLQFFMDLAGNNHKAWFDENRKRYEQRVREPFKVLVADLIEALKDEIPGLDLAPKDCIFRINRDIRFSKDKTPYKLHASAAIARGGKKDMVSPGLYLQLDPEHTRIYSGSYMPDKTRLYGIREKITNNLDEFDTLINQQPFKEKFGEIHGDKNKVIPKEFKTAAAQQPLIFNKNFYYYNFLEPEACLEDDFIETLVHHFKAAKPLNEFLEKVG